MLFLKLAFNFSVLSYIACVIVEEKENITYVSNPISVLQN